MNLLWKYNATSKTSHFLCYHYIKTKICTGHPIFLQLGEVRVRAKIFWPGREGGGGGVGGWGYKWNITKGTMDPRVDFFVTGLDLEFEMTQVPRTNQYYPLLTQYQ